MNKSPLVASLVALGLLAGSGHASDLNLNGSTATSIAYGDPFQVELSASSKGAGLPAFLFADTGPGPVAFLGELIPLDMSAQLFVVFSGVTNGSGTWSVLFPTPSDPTISGAKLYMGGVVFDPTDTNGLDFSNGAVLDIGPPVGAGADQAGLVGRKITFDGSSAASADGTIPLGASLHWQLTNQPGGSSVSLSVTDTLYPTLLPDVAGDYTAQLTVTHGGVSNQASSTLHVWDLDLGSGIEGKYFPTATTVVTGTLKGPAPASFTLDGVPVSTDAGGNFGPLLVSLDPNEKLSGLLFEVTHTDGTIARARQTVGVGNPGWVAFGASNSALAHLDTNGFAALSKGVEETLEQTDLATYVTGIPTATIAKETGPFGFTIFSALINFTAMKSDPNLVVTLMPNSSNVFASVRMTGVQVDYDVWGKILEIPYSLSGDSTSSAVDITADLKLKTTAGKLDLDVTNVNVALTNFNFDLYGFLGDVAQLFLIESWVKDTVVETMESEIGSQIGPVVLDLLSAFEFSIDLAPEIGVNTLIDLDFVSALHNPTGVTLGLSTKVTTGAPLPGSPEVDFYLTTPSSNPTFGATTPTGKGYGGALAASDDFLNLILASLTKAGMLEGDLAALFPPDPGGSGGTTLTTEVLAVLFPGAGFQLFPSGTVVELVSHGVMPPVVSTTPAGPGILRMDLAGLEVSLEVPTPAGSVPVLRLVLDGFADMDMIVEPDGTLGATLLGTAFVPTVLSGFPGSSIPSLQAGSDFLIQMLIPQLTEALGVIPVPSLDQEGLTLTTDEVHLTGAGAQFMGFWGNMVYSPPAP
jgi:hypothetical protein